MTDKQFSRDAVTGKRIPPMEPGICCPDCGAQNHAVVDSRPNIGLGVGTLRRRRKCLNCGEGFTTIEFSLSSAGKVRASILDEAIKSLQDLKRRETGE